MQRQRKIALRDSLLTRYSQSLGELMMRRNTETAIRAAKAESDLASRAKSAFLATMSHELRTPLNAIIGFSDVIVSSKDGSDKAAEYAGHIAASGRRMLNVVTDILDISKIESGSFALDCQPNDPGEIIDAAVEAMREEIAAKNQTLDVRVPAGLPMLNVDHKRVRQILTNLLSNACKFTPPRGRIVIVARKNPDGGATIAVADTGVGMSPDQIAIAMTPFGQVQGHLARTQEGAGLGLSIARGLARRHGGDLHMESQRGVGTTVFLTLPAGSAP
jgi:signal transduction histidine kinase